MKLENKVVWITGASSGIGEALAYEMAKAGAKLILSSRNEIELMRVKEACIHSEKHVVVPLDLERYLELEQQTHGVWEKYGPIDVLVNNAGISQRCSVVDSSIAIDKKIMDINFFGTVALTRLVLNKMLQRDIGHIVVTSSMLGLYGIQTRTAYSASKHALRGYFESLRNELVHTQLKITLVYPGYINTRISINALLANGTTLGEMDASHSDALSAEKCAQSIIRGITRNKAVVVIAGPKERFGAFLVRFFPALFRYLSPKFDV